MSSKKVNEDLDFLPKYSDAYNPDSRNPVISIRTTLEDAQENPTEVDDDLKFTLKSTDFDETQVKAVGLSNSNIQTQIKMMDSAKMQTKIKDN